jgi:hypothetical protein
MDQLVRQVNLQTHIWYLVAEPIGPRLPAISSDESNSVRDINHDGSPAGN